MLVIRSDETDEMLHDNERKFTGNWAGGTTVSRAPSSTFRAVGVQAPYYTQSYNRYSYVMNQPMVATDPSGYWSFTRFFVSSMRRDDRILSAMHSIVTTPLTLGLGRGYEANYNQALTFLQGPNGYQLKSFAIGVVSMFCYAGAPACYAGMTYALNRGYGDGHHAARKKADVAFISGTAFQLAGMVNSEMVNGVDQGANSYGRYAAHATAGCVSAVAGGGKCGQGAVSAVFGKFTSNAIGSYGGNDVGSMAARGAMTVIAGGIGAELAGGKFENGAKTAAMGYLYNELMHTRGKAYDGATPGSTVKINLFSTFGETGMWSAALLDNEIDGFANVYARGNGSGMADSSGNSLDAAVTKDLLIKRGWNAQPVVLYSCNCANGPFAQNLANLLGVPVFAADGYYFYDKFQGRSGTYKGENWPSHDGVRSDSSNGSLKPHSPARW